MCSETDDTKRCETLFDPERLIVRSRFVTENLWEHKPIAWRTKGWRSAGRKYNQQAWKAVELSVVGRWFRLPRIGRFQFEPFHHERHEVFPAVEAEVAGQDTQIVEENLSE